MTQPPPATLDAALAQLAQRDRELLELRVAQEEFLRAVSHDLRAPLRHITSYGALVRELLDDAGLQGDAAAEARQFLGTMDQSTRRMACMLDGLLHIARAARAPLHPGPVDLAALLRDAQAELARTAPERTVAWSLPAESFTVHTDAALARQLVAQLLDNAFKFTRPRAGACVTARLQAGAGGGWQLQVQDNGVGLEPARAGALGGVFQRLHRDSEFEGVGTGLALVQTIAQRLGARWRIEGQPGGGCTVTVEQ